MALLLFSLLVFCAEANQKHIELTPAIISPVYINQAKQTTFFSLRITKEYFDFDPKQNLVIKVMPNLHEGETEESVEGDPDLYISKSNQYPETYSENDWDCSSQGTDICSISHEDININDVFYIGVRCFKACSFSLYPQLLTMKPLEDGVLQELDFLPKETKFFTFYISQGQHDNSIKALTVQATPVFAGKYEGLILSAATARDEHLPSSLSRRGIPGWKAGMVLRLSEAHKEQWCTDCWVTIMVDVTNAGLYTVIAKTNHGYQTIKDSEQVNDAIFFGDTQLCYKYYIKRFDSDVQVKVALFSGLVLYSLNPLLPPTNHSESMYKNPEGSVNSILMLKGEDRQDHADGLYFLCIQPLLSSTFSVLFLELPHDRKFEVLSDQFTELISLKGQSKRFFLYRVPPLEYPEEDIVVEFRVNVLSLLAPRVRAKLSPLHGATVIKDEELFLYIANKDIQYVEASHVLQDRLVIFDHDEKVCRYMYANDCAYIIEIDGEGEANDTTKFTITGTHFQQNYKQLHESQMLSDFVHPGQYKYYEFSLLDDTMISEIKFHIDTLHGDADIYAARNDPGASKKEKSSTHSNPRTDEVSFSKMQGDILPGQYIVNVHSMSFSTYNIMVRVLRTDAPSELQKAVFLTEGLSHRDSLNNTDGNILFAINHQSAEGLKLKIQTTRGNWARFYVSLGQRPTIDSHQWVSKSGSLIITPKDPNFKNQAVYYILLTSSTSEWLSETIKDYSFVISYNTQDTFKYLRFGLMDDLQTRSKETQYFRHYFSPIFSDEQTLTLSLTLWAGDAQIFVSLSPNDKLPLKLSPSYIAPKFRDGKTKLVVIPSTDLLNENPACNLDPQVSNEEACALYAAVYCQGESDCTYSIKLTSSSDEVETLSLGIVQHGVIPNWQFKYYLLEMKEQSDKDLQIILTSSEGNADIYVNLIDNYENEDNLDKPNLYDYFAKSATVLGKDIIRLTPEHLETCYSRNEPKLEGERTCLVAIGVYAPEQITNETDWLFTSSPFFRYSIIAYTDLVYLQAQSPLTSTVEEGKFNYYLIESTCDVCELIITLSQINAGGDPDLYINYGDQRLPTLNEYDMAQTTYRSELITINIRSQFFIENQIHSLRGPYIIGVFGNRKATYTISFCQEKSPISVITDGQAVRSTQIPYEIIYFTWQNLHPQMDIRINFLVKSGIADLFISTFDEEAGRSETLAQRLPKSKRDPWTYWVSEDNQATSNVQKQSFIITNQERHYCSSCLYIIGVVTHQQEAEYVLYVDVFDATLMNSRFIKVGELYTRELDSSELIILRFVLDDATDLTIQQTVNGENPNVVSRLSFDSRAPDDKVIASLLNTESQSLESGDQYLRAQSMYYLYVKNNGQNSKVSIQVTQERTVLTLIDGVPVKLTYQNEREVSKFLLMQLPKQNNQALEYIIKFQIKSLTPGFYPSLYSQLYQNINEQVGGIAFPPAGYSQAFDECHNWDRRLQILTCQFSYTLESSQSMSPCVAINLYDQISQRTSSASEVYLTASFSNVMTMIPELQYQDDFASHSSFQIYRVSEEVAHAENAYLRVDSSQCLGDIKLEYLRQLPSTQLQRESKQIAPEQTYNEFGKTIHLIKLPQKELYISTTPLEREDFTLTSYLIKISTQNRLSARPDDIQLSHDSRLRFTVEETKQTFQVDLSWGALSLNGSHLTTIEEYIVIISTDKNANLESQCAITHDVTIRSYLHNYYTHETHFTHTQEKPKESMFLYFNVFAKVPIQSKANIGDSFEYIPYNSIDVQLTVQQNNRALWVYTFFGVIGLCIVGQLFLKFRIAFKARRFANLKPVKAQNFEMTSIRHDGEEKTGLNDSDITFHK